MEKYLPAMYQPAWKRLTPVILKLNGVSYVKEKKNISKVQREDRNGFPDAMIFSRI